MPEVATGLRKKYEADIESLRLPVCDYWHGASIRAHWPAFLTFLGISLGIGFGIWAVVPYGLLRRKLDKAYGEALVLVLVLLVSWVYLRYYSEWFIKFGDAKLDVLPLLLVILLFYGLLFFSVKDPPRTLHIATVITGGVSTLGAILKYGRPELLDPFLEAYAQRGIPGLIGFNIAIGILVFLLV